MEERIKLEGTVACRPIRGRSPKGRRCIVVVIVTEAGERIVLAGFMPAIREQLSAVEKGDVLEIVGRQSNLTCGSQS